jgi:hypothetical protein
MAINSVIQMRGFIVRLHGLELTDFPCVGAMFCPIESGTSAAVNFTIRADVHAFRGPPMARTACIADAAVLGASKMYDCHG